MSLLPVTFDSLSADQRAVLELVLTHQKSYEEIAGLLALDRSVVKERVTQALADIVDAPPPGQRQLALAVDYLLGQQAASLRLASRQAIEQSEPLRTWLLAAAALLRPTVKFDLPEIPQPKPEVDAAFNALQARKQRQVVVKKSSRLGGILLLTSCAGAIAVLLILFLTRDNETKSSAEKSTSSLATSSPTSATEANDIQPERQVNLLPAKKNSKALGVASIARQGDDRILGIIAEGLKATSQKQNYAVWLVDGPSGSAKRLGFTPPVGKKGRVEALSLLPKDAARYRLLVLTRERSAAPEKPGVVILRGAFTLKN